HAGPGAAVRDPHAVEPGEHSGRARAPRQRAAQRARREAADRRQARLVDGDPAAAAVPQRQRRPAGDPGSERLPDQVEERLDHLSRAHDPGPRRRRRYRRARRGRYDVVFALRSWHRRGMATAISQERLSSYNPATGDLLGSVPIFSAAEVEAAVARARVASETWSTRSFAARNEELDAFRHALAAAADTIADILHRENGKPELEALTEVMMSLGHLKHAVSRAEAAMAPKKVSAGLLANFRATISYAPLGVVAGIGPWNYPLNTPMGSIAYALAAGNAVVWKPSELTPLVALEIEKIAKQVFALPDLLQVVT